MNAVVLCGGLGTRLGELTKDTPKPLLDVAGQPFVTHVLERLQSNGVRHVCLAVSFQWQKIHSTLGESWKGLPLTYSVEDTPLGTGGAIRRALTTMDWSEALVTNGDTFVEANLRQIQAFAHRSQADVVLTLKHVPNVARYGRVNLLPSGRVTSFNEKGKSGPGFINAGLFWLRSDLLTGIPDDVFSFEHHVMMKHLPRMVIYGLITDGYFIDMGIPEDLKRARHEVALWQ
ncbi:nucleotidyltransferase family protein [Synechococcus sp. LTW-G]